MSKPASTQRDTSEVHGRTIAVAALGVLLLVVMVAALIRLLSTLLGTTTAATLSTRVETPRLSRPDSSRELADYQAAQAAWLRGYGWQDGTHSYAHIPIERAMQLLAQHPDLAQPSAPPPAVPR